ncbi:MAG TPA: PilZ domain-containing protein [Pseudomonadales bacterium]|nr:PilZ domain-containing protein [Pseudomonadales bacterium]
MDSGDFVSRRKYPRHTLRNSVLVVDQLSGESVGAVANLSLEGLMLVNNKPLRSDCIYQLKMVIAEDVIADAAGSEISIGVDCLWSSPAESIQSSSYWSGCQIIDISDADFSLMKQLIAAVAEQG